MSFHIKIGTRSLCQCGPIFRLLSVQEVSALCRLNRPPVCGHETRAEAQDIVDRLRQRNHDARVVDGECDQQGGEGPI